MSGPIDRKSVSERIILSYLAVAGVDWILFGDALVAEGALVFAKALRYGP